MMGGVSGQAVNYVPTLSAFYMLLMHCTIKWHSYSLCSCTVHGPTVWPQSGNRHHPTTEVDDSVPTSVQKVATGAGNYMNTFYSSSFHWLFL